MSALEWVLFILIIVAMIAFGVLTFILFRNN